MTLVRGCVLAVAVLMFHASAYGGEAFAPKVPVPSGIKEGSPESMDEMIIQSSVVPDRSAVGVPPYPGAKIFQARGTMKMEVNDETVSCLPYIKLYTTDPKEKVVAFYKDKIKDFHFKSQFGGLVNLFWMGPDKINAMDMTQLCSTPNVSITDGSLDLMSGSKTVIEITYK